MNILTDGPEVHSVLSGGSQRRARRKTLKWTDVLPAAKIAFSIWVDQPELRWAKEAWGKLIHAGLAAYGSELERCEVAVRFLALAGLYHDFCQVAWGEPSGPNYLVWAEELTLHPFRVGQLVGRDPPWDHEETESDLVADALEVLPARARGEVFTALRDGFGGISGLFISLWRSIDKGSSESDWEIVNDLTPDKGAAFTWIEQGCLPIG